MNKLMPKDVSDLKEVKEVIESNYYIYHFLLLKLNYFTKNTKYNQKSPNNFQA